MSSLEIANRCEQANGPDRRLDAQIEIVANPTKAWIVGEKPGNWPREPIYGTLADFWEWATDESKGPPELNAPRYTASLDAAVALIPGRVRLAGLSQKMNGSGWYAHLMHRDSREHFEARGETCPLTVCAAALRALAAIAMETQRAETENTGSVAKP